MNGSLEETLSSFNECSCLREHKLRINMIKIGEGLAGITGSLLKKAGFPERLLLVADENTIAASRGLVESLKTAGFIIKTQIFDNLISAKMEDVTMIRGLCPNIGGILAVGTGSICDVCRYAAFKESKAFAIFATGPSMDGFASNSAPLIENGFKLTYQARQPEVIIADTGILAAAPAELKSAGFGDMAAKYTALADWRIAHLLTGEYYCPRVAELVLNGLNRVMNLADRVLKNDPETAAAMMAGLVMTGVAMSFTGNSRPASGAEHVLSHFWECKKLQAGEWPDFHGKKTGVASLLITELYRKLAGRPSVGTHADETDWEKVREAYGGRLAEEMMKLNRPATVTDDIDPKLLSVKWPEIRRIIFDTLPETNSLRSLLIQAGAATEPRDIHVDDKLLAQGLKYHAYMRNRVNLTRLMPMLSIKDDDK